MYSQRIGTKQLKRQAQHLRIRRIGRYRVDLEPPDQEAHEAVPQVPHQHLRHGLLARRQASSYCLQLRTR